MDAHYSIKGLWDMENSREFYGIKFQRFLADLPSMQDEAKTTPVAVYIPQKYFKDGSEGKMVELNLEPGTYIMQLVPFTIVVGDPTGLPRKPILYSDDLMVENSAIRAIPASRAIPSS